MKFGTTRTAMVGLAMACAGIAVSWMMPREDSKGKSEFMDGQGVIDECELDVRELPGPGAPPGMAANVYYEEFADDSRYGTHYVFTAQDNTILKVRDPKNGGRIDVNPNQSVEAWAYYDNGNNPNVKQGAYIQFKVDGVEKKQIPVSSTGAFDPNGTWNGSSPYYSKKKKGNARPWQLLSRSHDVWIRLDFEIMTEYMRPKKAAAPSRQ